MEINKKRLEIISKALVLAITATSIDSLTPDTITAFQGWRQCVDDKFTCKDFSVVYEDIMARIMAIKDAEDLE